MAGQPPSSGNSASDPEETRVDAPAEQPTMLLDGKYRVERVIGEGAFGRVYLAQDTRLRRPVAIKELLASRNNTDPDLYQRYLDRFGREARAGGAITHANVVTVYEMGIDEKQNTYLVMEYVDGTNLRDLLSQVGTLPVERVVAIALDIARGLEAVHEQDIVHRDLKPANIMISRRGGAKVGDFGIAQVGTESQRTQVSMGHPGTPLYMSPEQSTGFGYIDGRSDLYSLGLIIYEMLVGEPYARRRLPLAQVKPNTPPALVAIVERLIQKDPYERFQSATDVVTELSHLSSAPQQSPLSGAYGFASGQPAYPQTPPPQSSGYGSGVPGAVPGVPSAYGGPPSQQPNVYGAPPPSQSGAPYASQQPGSMAQGYAPPSQPPPAAVYQTQQGMYQPPQGPPQPRKRGLAPIAIIGIVGGVVLIAVVAIIAVVASGGGGKTATATPGSTATTVANVSPTTGTGGTTATASAGSSTTVAINRATNTPGSTPGASPTVRPSASNTPRPTSAATATPLPPASGAVKLSPGKPLPTTILPQIYVDDMTRYTLHYPAEWKQSPGDENTDVHFDFNGSNIAGVTTEDLNGGPKPSVQQIADELNATFSKQLTNFKLTDASQVKVGKLDALRMLYTFTDKGNTVTLGGYLLGFSTDATLVLFQGYEKSDAFNSRVPTFDTVAASFTDGVSLENTYSNTQKGFTFDYPDGWSEQKASTPGIAVLVAPTSGVPTFNVVTENKPDTTLQQYYDGNVRTISTVFKNYKKVAESDTTIGGQPAKLQIYTADLAGNGTIYQLHQWYIVKDGVGYVLTYAMPVDRAQEFAGIGPIIVSTFDFS